MSIQTVRRAPAHPMLKSLVRYLWLMISGENESMNHWLMPVCNADLVVNLSFPAKYTYQDGQTTLMTGAHLCGIRMQCCHVVQMGPLRVLGAAFHSAGLYPFVSEPLATLVDRTIPLETIIPGFSSLIFANLAASPEDELQVLENELIRALDSISPDRIAIPEAILKFSAPGTVESIKSFCAQNDIHPRRLERLFRRHVGIAPKEYLMLSRFHGSVLGLIDRPQESLTEQTYDYGYYDQPHFNRTFIRFTGRTPSDFKARKDSVLERIRNR